MSPARYRTHTKLLGVISENALMLLESKTILKCWCNPFI